jgi:hypothetical protein
MIDSWNLMGGICRNENTKRWHLVLLPQDESAGGLMSYRSFATEEDAKKELFRVIEEMRGIEGVDVDLIQ